jgi:molecular chaperone DnaK
MEMGRPDKDSPPVFEVKSTSGDTQLGGTDMDNALVDYVANEFKTQTGVDVRNDKTAIQRIREAGEKAKIELSTVITSEINLPFLSSDASGPKHLQLTLSRAKLEELVRPIIDRCRGPLMRALEDSKLTPSEVDKVILVGGPTRMPIVRKFVEDFTGKEAERAVDPMECVALGAAIQGGVIGGEVRDILLLDVTPLSLGVETLGGVATKIIERNTTIPTRRSQIFSTAADFQTTVTIHVLQGERPMSADNVSLGMFNLTGIPPAPRGIPQIEVTFDIDTNGILNASAKDLATGKEQKIAITGSTKLEKSSIDKMVKEAEQFADQDRLRREDAELRNLADNNIYVSEKLKVDLKEKITKEQTERLDKAVADLREALSGKDMQNLKAKNEALQKVMQEIGAAAYQEVAKAAASSSGGTTGTSEGSQSSAKSDAVDAEYKVVDDEKK